MRLLSACCFLLASVAWLGRAQNVGTQKQEYHLPMQLQVCSGAGQCQVENNGITLDSNWRWTHNINGYTNCYTGNQWDKSLCPDPATCTRNCALDGVPQSDWASPYGISAQNSGIQMNFVTRGQYGTNIGSRVYMMSGDKYRMFKLKNKEFAFDVDVSNLPCGLNGALYFVEMPEDGGLSDTNKAGAKYGTGYCDAQCPHDIKFIRGEANVLNWTASPTDRNAGTGHYGTCCSEMDIWEANKMSSAYTAHVCKVGAAYRCEGLDCGDAEHRYDGVCDKDGCDFNAFRLGNENFYGPGSQYELDTTKPMTVVTQFLTTDGTDHGDLKEIRRLYVQNGKVVQNSRSSFGYDSLSDATCSVQKQKFGERSKFAELGGMKTLGQSLDRGMVLVMSLWDDHAVDMLWLDSDYPTNVPNTNPGVHRGPCSTSSGKPDDVENNNPNSSVKYSNIKVGAIGSTFPHGFVVLN
jgi:cellulose 1,4-beta-cellobiosidase